MVHAPALSSEEAVGHPPTPANVLSCNLAETMTQFYLLGRDDLGRMALGSAMLTHHTADQPLRCPGTLLQDGDSPAPAFGAQKFPSARSLSIAFSNSASAKSFLSLAFSFSS